MKSRFLSLSSLVLGLGALALTGCFQDEGVPAADGPKPAPSMRCADLTPDQQRKGDSLVALAQKLQTDDVTMMSGGEDWNGVDRARLQATLDYYNEALAAAPGHCGAVFGRALAQAVALIDDQTVNEAMVRALPKGSGSKPLAKAFKASRDEAAPLVLKVASGMAKVEKPWISSQQDYLAQEILPVLDTVIAALDAAMARPDFAIRFERNDGRPVEIDKGEVGPVLGGLKVARAIILVLAGYQWEIAHEGSYAWLDRAVSINPEDMRALSPVQKEALDHFTGLFEKGSPFTRVKPAWKPAVKGIPALLLEAVENTQAGLRYAIAEAGVPGKQDYDLYRVGTTELDDVDPADLAGIVDALERTKKYLRGEANLEYRHTKDGVPTHTLQVNFPKIFSWDGVQGMLPYHKVLPYGEWVGEKIVNEDYPMVDRGWSDGMPAGPSYNRVMQALDLYAGDSYEIRQDLDGTLQVVLYENQDWFTPNYVGPDVVMATLKPEAGNPCRLRYDQDFVRVRILPHLIFPGNEAFRLDRKDAEGVIDLSFACKVENGRGQFRREDALEFQTAFHFTDASGKKTLGIQELELAVHELGLAAALTGKVVFPDPTFGGVFPGLTNQNIWATMESLGRATHRVDMVCNDEGECKHVMPKNPADIDVWAYYLFWLDDLL